MHQKQTNEQKGCQDDWCHHWTSLLPGCYFFCSALKFPCRRMTGGHSCLPFHWNSHTTFLRTLIWFCGVMCLLLPSLSIHSGLTHSVSWEAVLQCIPLKYWRKRFGEMIQFATRNSEHAISKKRTKYQMHLPWALYLVVCSVIFLPGSTHERLRVRIMLPSFSNPQGLPKVLQVQCPHPGISVHIHELNYGYWTHMHVLGEVPHTDVKMDRSHSTHFIVNCFPRSIGRQSLMWPGCGLQLFLLWCLPFFFLTTINYKLWTIANI